MEEKKSHNWLYGGLTALAVLSLYSMKRRKGKPDLFVKRSLPFGFNAITVPPLGIFVKVEHAENAKLLHHELRHWKQYQECGLLRFIIKYAGGSIMHGYDGNPMEKEARENESEYCRENYTECVRCGVADTVNCESFRE